MPRIIRGSWLITSFTAPTLSLPKNHSIIIQAIYMPKTYDIIILYGATYPRTYCIIFQQVTCIHSHTELRIKERYIFHIHDLCNFIHTMDNFNLQIELLAKSFSYSHREEQSDEAISVTA